MTKRKPTAHGRPPPSRREVARIDAARKSRSAREAPVAVAATKTADKLNVHSPHSDAEGWTERLLEAFGTASFGFASTQLTALGEDEDTINASLALVQAVKPANELEAALAVQMTVVHRLSLYCASKTLHAGMIPQAQTFGSLAVKATRTFAALVEALTKYRSGGKQQVEVRYVYVNGDAVFGDVQAGGGGGPENRGRPHAPVASLPFTPGAPMPCVFEADREPLPSAGGEGAESMSDAWGR